MPPPRDITGQIFGRLRAIRRAENYPRYRQSRWLFACECGNEYTNFGYLVWLGKVVSCGCYIREALKAGRLHLKHGKTGTPEFNSWVSMRARCLRSGDAAYPDYGGRGITVCQPWNDFAVFLSDMGVRPTPRRTLDRIDNDGDYCPQNCRWADKTTQVRNRRTSTWIEVNGVKMHVNEVAEMVGMTPSGVMSRYLRGRRGADLLAPPRADRRREEKRLLRPPASEQAKD